MYRALYRKWRPRDFDDVCGQNQITDILKYEVAEKKTTHAYLFCGSRGTGKTTCAKILAKAVNCENPQNGNPCNCCPACRAIDAGTATDVIEMDAASNTGVDNVRDIKDEIVFTPAEMKYRVYIIDEVHMMTGNAFNALLKTLEEPPEHVVFILATTELQKLPSTIISRCQRFDFRRLPVAVIVERMKKISAEEKIDLEEDGARIIARMALGGMRDAISLLELCAGTHRRVDAALVSEMLGAGNRATIEKLVRAIADKNYTVLYGLIAEEVMSSRDLAVFWRDIIEYYRDMLVAKTTKNAKEYLDLTDEETAALTSLAERFPYALLLYESRLLEEAQVAMSRQDASKRAIAELTLTRMCEPKLTNTPESLLARIDALESEVSRLKYGGYQPKQAPVEDAAAPAVPMPDETLAPAGQPEKTAEKPEEDHAPVYRAVSAWREIISHVSSSIGGLLQTTKAYRSEDGTTYLIKGVSDFARGMLTRPESEREIRAAIGEEEERDVSACRIVFESQSNQNDYRLIDEIEEALQ